jgi:hypothetical protein
MEETQSILTAGIPCRVRALKFQHKSERAGGLLAGGVGNVPECSNAFDANVANADILLLQQDSPDAPAQ